MQSSSPSRNSTPLVRLLPPLIALAFGFFVGRFWPSSTVLCDQKKGTSSSSHQPAQPVTETHSYQVARVPANSTPADAELLSLRNQLSALRNAVSDDESLRNRIIERGGAGLLGLGIGEDFLVGDDLADFMKLTVEQRQDIKNLAARILESVKAWEKAHAQIVEEKPGKLLSCTLPPSDAVLSRLTVEYTSELKAIVGQRNYEMIRSQVESLFAEFGKERIITYYTVPNEQGTLAYQFSVEWRDTETGDSGGSDEAGAVFSEIPSRWQHLFSVSVE